MATSILYFYRCWVIECWWGWEGDGTPLITSFSSMIPADADSAVRYTLTSSVCVTVPHSTDTSLQFCSKGLLTKAAKQAQHSTAEMYAFMFTVMFYTHNMHSEIHSVPSLIVSLHSDQKKQASKQKLAAASTSCQRSKSRSHQSVSGKKTHHAGAIVTSICSAEIKITSQAAQK